MTHEIRRRNGTVIIVAEGTSFGHAVVEALRSGAVLSGADLRCADLRGAVLRDADLRDVCSCDAEVRS